MPEAAVEDEGEMSSPPASPPGGEHAAEPPGGGEPAPAPVARQLTDPLIDRARGHSGSETSGSPLRPHFSPQGSPAVPRRRSKAPRPHHEMPARPRPVDYLLFWPLVFQAYVQRISRAFGMRFFLTVMVVYGIGQGAEETWGFNAMQYYLSDPSSRPDINCTQGCSMVDTQVGTVCRTLLDDGNQTSSTGGDHTCAALMTSGGGAQIVNASVNATFVTASVTKAVLIVADSFKIGDSDSTHLVQCGWCFDSLDGLNASELNDILVLSANNITNSDYQRTAHVVDAKWLGLGLEPEKYNAVESLATVPWQMKVLFGIMSDNILIRGRKRAPYIIIASVLGMVGTFLIATTPGLGVAGGAVCLLLWNLSMASPDVIIDASVAERCKTHPSLAADLQSLCWGSFGVWAILAAPTSGYIYDGIGSRGIYFLCFCCCVCVLIPASLGWLPEKQDAQAVGHVDLRRCAKLCKEAVSKRITILACFIATCAITMGLISSFGDRWGMGKTAQVGTTLGIGASVGVAVLWGEWIISPAFAKASLYIFLSGALQPTTKIMFYWYRENEENCARDRPCFSPEFIGYLDLFGMITFVVGTVLYNRYLSQWSYRRIWAATQFFLVGINFLDLLWVKRLNRSVGMPDTVMVLTYEALAEPMNRFNTMPLFVLAAHLCPEGMEATLFAMNMGLANLGVTVGKYVGIALIAALGGIEAPEFNNFETLITIRSLTRFLPILLIPYLVPPGSPADHGDDGPPEPEEGLELGELSASRSAGGHRVAMVEGRDEVDEDGEGRHAPSMSPPQQEPSTQIVVV